MPRLYPPGIKKLLSLLRLDRIGNENGFKELADYRGVLNRGALHVAAEAGLTDACKYLVEGLKLDVNEEDTCSTPVVFAAMRGHTATAKYLVENGAAIARESGFSALHHAAANGDFELMKFLLDKGVSVDLRNGSGCTPLAWAARNSRENVVKFLLEHGADPDGEPDDRTTPLQEAIFADSVACSELLIEAGADPNLVANGFNPLHYAANGGIVEIINLLLQAGANPNAISDVLFTDDVDDDCPPRKPIEVAAARGHKEAVEILFPITERIGAIKEWSVDGILGELQPEHLRKKGRKRGQPKSRV